MGTPCGQRQLHGQAHRDHSRRAGSGGEGFQTSIRATVPFGSRRSCPLRRLIFVVFSSRRVEIARFAKAASRRGSEPLRMRLRSSRKTTSRTQWMRFSMPR